MITRPLRLTIGFGLLTLLLTIGGGNAHGDDEVIDMQRVRELRARVRKGEKLSEEDQKYYDLGVKERQNGNRSRSRNNAGEEDNRTKSKGKSKHEGPSIQPTVSDVSYGPDKSNQLDLWLAKSDSPTPLIIFIHGGGFHEGDKRNYPNFEDELLKQALDQRISFASSNYRLSKDGFSYPAPMHDCARAVQYIRSRAQEWNLDPKRFAATGRSAGAGISEWLAFHDDMAKPGSSDPVERQSTRLSCCVPINMQSTYDPRVIKTLIPNNIYQTPDLKLLYGLLKTFDWDKEKIDEALDAKLRDCSPVTHLTKDDPPAFALSQNVQNIHSPNMAIYLKKRMDELGIECERHMESEFGNPVDRANTILEFVKKQFKNHPLP